MKKILFIDATVRPESRTREIAIHLVRKLRGEVTNVKLTEEDIPATCNELLQFRDNAIKNGDYSSKYFKYAKQFQEADYIVIASPYWDLSFPAILKSYIEAITINGLTFEYTEDGMPHGLCNGKKLYYVTTSGGPYIAPEFSSGYIKAMATQMFGVDDYQCIAAENLDIIGADVDKIVKMAKDKIDSMIKY